jgi:SH3-like domain-containing protein
VEPLEKVGGDWWIKTDKGEPGFVRQKITGPFVGSSNSVGAISSSAGDGSSAPPTFPPRGFRDFELRVLKEGGLLSHPDENADTVQVLKPGFRFKPARVYGVFYEVKGKDGTRGWINTVYVAANPDEPMSVVADSRLRAEPDTGQSNFLGDAQVRKGDRVVIFEKQGNWGRVARKDGLQGWLYLGTVLPTRRIPAGTNMFLFPKFRWMVEKGRQNNLLGLLFWIFFLLVFLLPALLSRGVVDFLGHRGFLPNWVVKLAIPASVIGLVALLARHIVGLPPYYNWNLQFFWVPVWGLYSVATVTLFWKDIGRHRCPACHRMKAGEMYDTQEQTVTTKTTTLYTDGSTTTNSDSTTSGTDYMQCAFCGNRWVYSWKDFR